MRKRKKDPIKKMKAIMHYNAAVVVFEKWLALGFISDEELVMIDSLAAARHGISPNSIYRRIKMPITSEFEDVPLMLPARCRKN